MVKRYHKELESKDVYVDWDNVLQVIQVAQQLKHQIGKFYGKQFILEPFQVFLLVNIFGFKFKDTGFRLYNECVLNIARKNGKTFLVSFIALWFTAFEGIHGSQVMLLSPTKELTEDNLFEMMKQHCKSLDPKLKYFKPKKEVVDFVPTNSWCKLSSVNSKSVGESHNLSFFV